MTKSRRPFNAAEVARFSILLYGNEFGQDELKKILKIEE